MFPSVGPKVKTIKDNFPNSTGQAGGPRMVPCPWACLITQGQHSRGWNGSASGLPGV